LSAEAVDAMAQKINADPKLRMTNRLHSGLNDEIPLWSRDACQAFAVNQLHSRRLRMHGPSRGNHHAALTAAARPATGIQPHAALLRQFQERRFGAGPAQRPPGTRKVYFARGGSGVSQSLDARRTKSFVMNVV
jgi:hypothetical protein